MINHYLADLFKKDNELQSVMPDILRAFTILKDCFINNGTLYVCGNGGSAADAEHIVGELMKSFMFSRKVKNSKFIDNIEKLYGSNSKQILPFLEDGLRSISLTGHPSLSTAFANDVKSDMVFAQQLYVLAKPNDVFWGISTSGNSSNVLKALQVATALNLNSIILTGKIGGKCSKIASCSIKVPADIVYKIQECHQPIYHTLCLMLEEYFYGKNSKKN